MIQAYGQETETIAQIERLEQDARNLRRRIEHVRGEEDKRVMNRQLKDIHDEVALLKWRLR